MTDSATQPTGAGAKHRHHVVPRFYLEGFISPDDPGALHMYEKGRPSARRLTPRVVASQEHFYTAELLGGVRDSNIVENVLKTLEDQAAPILRKTLQGEQLTAEERHLFAYFVATMYLRVPHFRSVNQQIQEERFKEQMRILVTDPRGRDWIEADIRRQEEETGRTCSEDARDFLERPLVEGSFTFEIWPEDTMRLLPVAQEWGHDLEGMQWTFLVADDAQFVTSDNPLVRVLRRPTSFSLVTSCVAVLHLTMTSKSTRPRCTSLGIA
jgi:Protein of unknown function (DUF4238)